jgi:hypothetical protein
MVQFGAKGENLVPTGRDSGGQKRVRRGQEGGQKGARRGSEGG